MTASPDSPNVAPSPEAEAAAGISGDYYAQGSLGVAFHDFLAATDRHLRGDVEFYRRLVKVGNEQVLDLACGAGRVSFALAEKGARVRGLDLSPAMIALARKKQSRARPDLAGRLRFETGDMTDFDLGQLFDVITIGFFSFNHVGSADNRLKVLRCIARHLHRHGCAAVHVLPDEWFSPLPDGPTDRFHSVPFDTTGRRFLARPKERSFSAGGGRMTTVMEYVVYSADGSVLRRSLVPLVYYRISDGEFRTAARDSGLQVSQAECRFVPEGPPQRMYVLEHDPKN